MVEALGVILTARLPGRSKSLRAHRAYIDGLGAMAFEPAAFLSWVAAASGARLGVDSAVLLEVHELIPNGPPPWAATLPSVAE